MERLWHRAWDRHGPRYEWAAAAITAAFFASIYAIGSIVVVGYEGSRAYLAGTPIGVLAGGAAGFVTVWPGSVSWRPVRTFVAGTSTDRLAALRATYAVNRGLVGRAYGVAVVLGGASGGSTALVAGAGPSRAAQHVVLHAAFMTMVDASGLHFFTEAMMRPARAAIVGGTALGDDLPRSSPPFTSWIAGYSMGVIWSFTGLGLLLSAVFPAATAEPLGVLAIAAGVTVLIGVPISLSAAIGPSLRPLRDLAEGTARVIAGDYRTRVPVVQDDDLGTLTASFNRMQAGLAQRERLQAAFGSYVDPALAARLLDQSDDLFTGERIDVTVMFVDRRDFTPFAEANTAEDAVSHLNALFEIVVPAVLDAGGHVNKFLGDGAMAVFGAPNALPNHADAAIAAARAIRRLVDDHFDGATRIGIGINTGQVIAGTIGGGGKLEFTLIGDTVNVAARIEQLTKTTGDTILLAQGTVDALTVRPEGLVDRGTHELRGKATRTRVHAYEPAASA